MVLDGSLIRYQLLDKDGKLDENVLIGKCTDSYKPEGKLLDNALFTSDVYEVGNGFILADGDDYEYFSEKLQQRPLAIRNFEIRKDKIYYQDKEGNYHLEEREDFKPDFEASTSDYLGKVTYDGQRPNIVKSGNLYFDYGFSFTMDEKQCQSLINNHYYLDDGRIVTYGTTFSLPGRKITDVGRISDTENEDSTDIKFLYEVHSEAESSGDTDNEVSYLVADIQKR